MTQDSSGAGAARPEVGAQAKVFRGEQGLKLTMLRIGPEKDATFLVMVEGIDNPLSGKWQLSRRKPAGTGFDYVIARNGKDYAMVIERDGWGWKRLQVYVPSGPQGTYVGYDTALSEAAQPQHLLTAYLQQQNRQ